MHFLPSVDTGPLPDTVQHMIKHLWHAGQVGQKEK